MVKQPAKGTPIRDKLPPLKCKGCSVVFVPKTRKQRYHSDTCREDYYNRTYYHREITEKMCPNCGITFHTTKPGRQDYCGPKCRAEASKKRRDGLTLTVHERTRLFYGERFRQMVADGFACRLCGKTVRDGIKLDVEDDGMGGRMTICNVCSEGRRAK